MCTCKCDLPPCPHLSGWPPLCGGAPAPQFWHCRSPWTSAEPEIWSGCSGRPPAWTPPLLLSNNTQMSCTVTQLTTGWIISASVTHCSIHPHKSTLVLEYPCLLCESAKKHTQRSFSALVKHYFTSSVSLSSMWHWTVAQRRGKWLKLYSDYWKWIQLYNWSEQTAFVLSL